MVKANQNGEVVLGFASQDPRWNQTVTLAGRSAEIDGVTHEIVALVVGFYRTKRIW